MAPAMDQGPGTIADEPLSATHPWPHQTLWMVPHDDDEPWLGSAMVRTYIWRAPLAPSSQLGPERAWGHATTRWIAHA